MSPDDPSLAFWLTGSQASFIIIIIITITINWRSTGACLLMSVHVQTETTTSSMHHQILPTLAVARGLKVNSTHIHTNIYKKQTHTRAHTSK